MRLNGTTVIDRHNRPAVNQKVALQAFFINDGVYQDPYEISGVAIFQKTTASAAQDFLNDDNLLVSSVASSLLMNFANSATLTTDSAFDTSNYTPGTTASGIFRTGVGKYIVVLDGTVNLSGNYSYWNSPSAIENSASSTGNYWDFWTVKLVQGSDYKVVSNEFALFDNTFFVITQPLLLKPRTKLVNKYINLGSRTDLKFFTEITIENKDIDESIKNIFRDSLITSAMVQILKLNDNHVTDSYVEAGKKGLLYFNKMRLNKMIERIDFVFPPDPIKDWNEMWILKGLETKSLVEKEIREFTYSDKITMLTSLEEQRDRI